MKPTTSIEVSGLQISLTSIYPVRGGFSARLKINHVLSPAGLKWLKKQTSGPRGAGEIITVTTLDLEMPAGSEQVHDAKQIVILEFVDGTTRESASSAIGRFLCNAKNSCPNNPDELDEFFDKAVPAESLYGGKIDPMAVASSTRPHSYN